MAEFSNVSSASSSTVTLNQDTPRVSTLARRIHGWSWQAFPIGMGTGAAYVALSGLEAQSHALICVETCFYVLNIVLFVLNSTTLLLQAILYPQHAWRRLKDPVKSLYVPLIVLSFATIIIGTIGLAVPASYIHPESIYVMFWVYVAFALLTCFPMLMIWFNKPHDLTTFTPAYAFLIFPMMLVGVVSFNVLTVMDATDTRTVGILLVGYFFQGLGFFMTFFYLCIYVIRIIMTGFLDGHQASGAFIACGPPGFTALTLISLGEHAQEILTRQNLISINAGEILYVTSIFCALFLYGLAVFFFMLGALPYPFKVHKHLHEILGCWALTFPNVGWIEATRVLGNIFDLKGFIILHLIMTVLMCATWGILFVFTMLAFVKGEIFMSKEEDVLKDSAKLIDLERGRKDEKSGASLV